MDGAGDCTGRGRVSVGQRSSFEKWWLRWGVPCVAAGDLGDTGGHVVWGQLQRGSKAYKAEGSFKPQIK